MVLHGSAIVELLPQILKRRSCLSKIIYYQSTYVFYTPSSNRRHSVFGAADDLIGPKSGRSTTDTRISNNQSRVQTRVEEDDLKQLLPPKTAKRD